jgi:hypothetical protein
VLPLQESLGKSGRKKRKKMGVWETYLMELGEGTENGRIGEGDKYEGIPT